ncbi:MAG: hypothetical protein ACLPN1_18865 [Dissulfurispiraceae bacterium]|jgi:hypothetical protein
MSALVGKTCSAEGCSMIETIGEAMVSIMEDASNSNELRFILIILKLTVATYE